MLFLASTGAPLLSNSSAASTWPLAAARCSGVSPQGGFFPRSPSGRCGLPAVRWRRKKTFLEGGPIWRFVCHLQIISPVLHTLACYVVIIDPNTEFPKPRLFFSTFKPRKPLRWFKSATCKPSPHILGYCLLITDPKFDFEVPQGRDSMSGACFPDLRPQAIVVLGVHRDAFRKQKLCSLDAAVFRCQVKRRFASGAFPGPSAAVASGATNAQRPRRR